MSKNTLIILFLALLKFSLPFLLPNQNFELHRDEYLYFEQGYHPDFGYLENPPLIGVLAYISSLFEGSYFWIKFWPAIFGALTLVITTSIAKELGGNIFAQLIAALGILFSAYLRIHFLFQPNFLDIFFWTLSAYFLVRYINRKKTEELYFLFIALAFGWLSKYSMLFFASSLFISILATKHRIMLSQKHFWLAALVGCFIILPNFIWQWQHRWPLIHHMNELRETQLKYLDRTGFIKEQFLMLFPVIFVWVGGLVWLLKNKNYRIISLIYLLTIGLLLMGSGKGYYALGVYPMLIAGGGVWLEQSTSKKRWLRYGLTGLILAVSLPMVPVLLPMHSPEKMVSFNQRYGFEKLGILKWEDQKNHPLQQDFADMLGWKEIAGKTKKFFDSLPISEQSETVVYCRNYGLAGACIYYNNRNYFSNHVISDNGTFLLWIPKRLWFKNLIYVGHQMPDKNDEVFQLFETVKLIDSVTNPLAREFGTKIIYFRNGSDSAWKLAAKGLKEMKSVFGE